MPCVVKQGGLKKCEETKPRDSMPADSPALCRTVSISQVLTDSVARPVCCISPALDVPDFVMRVLVKKDQRVVIDQTIYPVIVKQIRDIDQPNSALL